MAMDLRDYISTFFETQSVTKDILGHFFKNSRILMELVIAYLEQTDMINITPYIGKEMLSCLCLIMMLPH